MNHTWQPDHRRLYRLQSWGNIRESQRVRWESESEAWFWQTSDSGGASDKGNQRENEREREGEGKASVVQMQQRSAFLSLLYNNNQVKNVNDSYSFRCELVNTLFQQCSIATTVWHETPVHIQYLCIYYCTELFHMSKSSGFNKYDFN